MNLESVSGVRQTMINVKSQEFVDEVHKTGPYPVLPPVREVEVKSQQPLNDRLNKNVKR